MQQIKMALVNFVILMVRDFKGQFRQRPKIGEDCSIEAATEDMKGAYRQVPLSDSQGIIFHQGTEFDARTRTSRTIVRRTPKTEFTGTKFGIATEDVKGAYRQVPLSDSQGIIFPSRNRVRRKSLGANLGDNCAKRAPKTEFTGTKFGIASVHSCTVCSPPCIPVRFP
jgi:hypothetical protein